MDWQEHMAPFGAAFGIGFCFVAAAEPLIIRFALRWGLVDPPDWRKVHSGTVPRLGGIAFLPALLITASIFDLFWPEYCQPHYWGLLGALCIISLVGLWDDLRDIPALVKLGFQFLAGAILFWAGYRFQAIMHPLSYKVIQLGYIDFFMTLFAVAAIINAINMLDGLDGLASGCTFIMATFLLINKLARGDTSAAVMCVAVMGITAAFLFFNFHPAKVFMGDAGSMFLGLFLASEMLDAASHATALTTILLPLVILGIPIFDMVRLMVTRASTSGRIFSADKNHIHHRLLTLGLSHRAVVVFMYALNVYMGILALLYKHVDTNYRILYLFNIALFLFMSFYLICRDHRSEPDRKS
ncbi:MAG: MraY family glycosyltransferase [Candidatus Hydrogenedentota bacterium]